MAMDLGGRAGDADAGGGDDLGRRRGGGGDGGGRVVLDLGRGGLHGGGGGDLNAKNRKIKMKLIVDNKKLARPRLTPAGHIELTTEQQHWHLI